MFEVDYFTLDATDSSNRYVSLSGTPLSLTNVAVDLIGGTAQALDGDFGVDGTRVKWDNTSYGLYNLIGENDHIRIIYDRS
jgi:hypothetical protein